MEQFFHRYAEFGSLVLRLGVAFLFIFHAPQKWLGWYGGPQWSLARCLLLGLTCVIGAACGGGTSPPPPSVSTTAAPTSLPTVRVYVTNEASGDLTVIDAATQSCRGSVPFGPVAPRK